MKSQPIVYRVICTCGKVVAERAADASNLPAENNRGIVESAAGAHKFCHEWRDEVAVVGVIRVTEDDPDRLEELRNAGVPRGEGESWAELVERRERERSEPFECSVHDCDEPALAVVHPREESGEPSACRCREHLIEDLERNWFRRWRDELEADKEVDQA